MTESVAADAPPRTETPPCAWCGGRDVRQVYRMEHLGIGRCRSCGLVFANPRETEQQTAARYQQREYFQGDRLKRYGYDDYEAHQAIHERVFQQALKFLEAVRPQKGRLLDIGCATGFLLQVALGRGWEPEGVDLSEWACEQARQRTGLPVHHGDVTRLPLEDGGYDALTMFDVIEHVFDPREVLAACARLLKPGGHLYLITPDQGGFQRKLLGRRWFHYKPLEHTYYFDRETLGRFLEEAGFSVVYARGNRRWVTPRFVTERLRYYSKAVGGALYGLFGRWNWSARLELPLYTGEMEVVAVKGPPPPRE